MSNEIERLEFAAKACGIDLRWSEIQQVPLYQPNKHIDNDWSKWNPLTSSSDCITMCANLGIDVLWYGTSHVLCEYVGSRFIDVTAYLVDHNNDKEAAWRYAATTVAAMIGGLK